jgi:uncharacterized phage infection (PIP) family protein YhgE
MTNERRGTSRLDLLENDLSEIGRAVSALAEGQRALTSSLSDFRDSVGQLANRVNAPQPTNWGYLIAACALVGTLGLAFLDPVKQQAERNEAGLRALSGDVGAVKQDLAASRERGQTNRDAINKLLELNMALAEKTARLEAQVGELD